jgi:hypothetical protein
VSDKPFYKDKWFDRKTLKAMVEEHFGRMASGNFDAELAELVDRLERYFGVRLMEEMLGVVDGLGKEIAEQRESIREMRDVLRKEHVKDVADYMQ